MNSNLTLADLTKTLEEFKKRFQTPPVDFALVGSEKIGILLAEKVPVDSGPFGPLGIKVLVSEHLPITKRVQFRFPKTKKRRIQNKWAKRQENWKEIPDHSIYLVNSDAWYKGIDPLRSAVIHNLAP